jgi:hypothetical protein
MDIRVDRVHGEQGKRKDFFPYFGCCCLRRIQCIFFVVTNKANNHESRKQDKLCLSCLVIPVVFLEPSITKWDGALARFGQGTPKEFSLFLSRTDNSG